MQETIDQSVSQKIRNLVQSRQAIILAHNYQSEEVQAVADFIGDSLELSRKAASTDAALIVFAGVKFMAETAKLLSPDKTVLLPRLDAGCPMADMVMPEDVRRLRRLHPEALVVTYVNSSVEVKAESDVCCTSANAVELVRRLPASKIIFLPDQNLGGYVQRQVPEKKVILFEGYCYVHNRFRVSEIEEMKSLYPDAVVIAHPEVPAEVGSSADEVLSTSGMIRFVSSSEASAFIVLTEEGLLQRMRRENPNKKILSVGRPRLCSNMKKTGLFDIELALVHNQYQIEIPGWAKKPAARALNEMLRYS